MENKKYGIKGQGKVCIITLYDRGFGTFAEALDEVANTLSFKDEKIMMMQTVDKENEPLKVVIVFEF